MSTLYGTNTRKTLKIAPLYKFYYNNLIIIKLINYLMKDGKKSVAEVILYKALLNLKDKFNKNPFFLLINILNLIKPTIKLKNLKKSNKSLQIPFPLFSIKHQYFNGIRWLIEAVRKRNERKAHEKLTAEISDILINKSSIITTKSAFHKRLLQEFVHFRWKLNNAPIRKIKRLKSAFNIPQNNILKKISEKQFNKLKR